MTPDHEKLVEYALAMAHRANRMIHSPEPSAKYASAAKDLALTYALLTGGLDSSRTVELR